MNERIKELAAQVEKYISTTNFEGMPEDEMTYDEIFQKKFAELIVRECMDLALSEQKRYAAFTHRNLSECAVTVSNFRLLMKDHFGVENERD
jgi:hypothetical protein